MRRLPLPFLALAPGLHRMVSRLEFPYGSRWANEMAALAAGLGPKWRQHFFFIALIGPSLSSFASKIN
jgi:hypothetical protein